MPSIARSSLISAIIGIAAGAIQGFFGGWIDLFFQRFIEIWSTLPFLYVVILLATFFKPSFLLLLAIMTLFEWIRMTYYMRTEIYREKTKEYCLAARSFGASRRRLIFRHLLPNCMTPLVTITPFAIVGAISVLTALDYLGYGLPAPTPSWGEMIDQAMDSSNRDKIWLSVAPKSSASSSSPSAMSVAAAVTNRVRFASPTRSILDMSRCCSVPASCG